MPKKNAHLTQIQRLQKGTKYEQIEVLPTNAMKVRLYADKVGTEPYNVIQRYDRFLAGTGSDPGYTIKCFQGINFIIPS